MKKNGQVSIEMLIVLGFILLFFIPLLFFSYLKIIEMNEDLASIQIQVAVSRIANTADSVGHMGPGASLLIDLYLPAGSNIKFKNQGSGSEVIGQIMQSRGNSEYVSVSWFSIDSQIKEIIGGVNYRLNISCIEAGKVSVNFYS